MWNILGAAPKATVREVTVIGPGYGESIVVHLGDTSWLVVDSCVDPASGDSSAALKYLTMLGVDVAQAVKLIVVSHWDDDHIRGISDLLDACPSAVFCCSTSFTKREFNRFVEVLSVGGKTTGNGNVIEFKRCLTTLAERKHTIRYASPGRQISDPGPAMVKSWSPSDYDDACFLNYVATNYPSNWGAMRRAVPGSPNLTSVVLSVDWGDGAVLLGADMEASADQRRGWGAIVAEAKRIGYPRGEVVKVPHHGSEGAHDARMWSELLNDLPLSIIAPVGDGLSKNRPPLSGDVRRVTSHSSETYLTAKRVPESVKKKEPAVARSLRDGGN